MADEKHTPGPWSEGFDDDGGFVFDSDMEKVADTFHQPNARLIAAAPKMLAALESAARVFANKDAWESPKAGQAYQEICSAVSAAYLG